MAKTVKVDSDELRPKGTIEKLGLSLSDEVALSSQIQKDFNSSEQTKWLWIPERNLDVKNYYGVIQTSEWPFRGASRIKSQFQRIVVDTLSANIVKSIFLPEHPIAVKPAPLGADSSDETLANLEYVEDLHNSLQDNEYHLHQVLDKAVPTALIESFVVLHPTYEYLTQEITTKVTRWVGKDHKAEELTYDIDTDSVETKQGEFVHSINMDNGYDEGEIDFSQMQEITFDVEKEVCVKDGITIKTINGYRFYMPLGTPGENPYDKVQTAPYVVHQMFYTIREAMMYVDQGYFDKIRIDPSASAGTSRYSGGEGKTKGKSVVASTVYDRQRELITYTKLQQAGFLLDTARLEYEYLEVLKWCGKYKMPDGKWQELIVWMDRNTNTILRVEKNILGVRPYFPIVPLPIDETPYGESVCKVIRPLVQELDLMLRTIVNIALMKSAPPRFYDPASGFNPGSAGQFGPNAWIPAREPAKNVLIPPQPEDPRIAMDMVKLLINIIERITGISETVQGQVSNKANTTATEVQQALLRSGVRFDQIYERVKDQLHPMFNYVHQLTLRFMPATKEVRLMGTENSNRLLKLHKSQLKGNYEFILHGNSVVSEQNELQNALTLYNTIGQHPYLSYKPESIYYVLWNIVKRLNPVALGKILPTPDEVKKLERARAQVDTQTAMQNAQANGQQMASKGQLDAMNAQMQIGTKRQELTLAAQKAQAEMEMSNMEHEQKMRHTEETHQMKLRQMKEAANAKKEIKPESKA